MRQSVHAAEAAERAAAVAKQAELEQALALQRRLTLTLDTPELGSAELPIAFGFGPSTGSLDWRGALVVIEVATAEGELTNADHVEGKVAVVQRGVHTMDGIPVATYIPVATKAAKAAAAGALAMVVVNPGEDNDGAAGEASIPVFCVNQSSGEAIIGAGEGVRLVLAPP